MSYARFGCDGSNVYVFATLIGNQLCLTCCGCGLGDDPFLTSTLDMTKHLIKHLDAGHVVLRNTFEQIWEDDCENFGVEK